MKVVVAPDSFKGTLTARQAADAMRRGILDARPDAEVLIVPLADGGEGTVDVLAGAIGGRFRTAGVRGPLGDPVDGRFLLSDDGTVAALEMASASGLALVPPGHRDPLRASTYGTGELIAAALDAGAGSILIAVGGSATVDGGCGAAAALGVRFLDQNDAMLTGPLAGGDLDRITTVDVASRHPRLSDCRLIVLCDVRNPLCGPEGAAAVFAPQKGADVGAVETLEANLSHLDRVVKRSLNRSMADAPGAGAGTGAGAAGGLGYGLAVFCGAELRSGVDEVLRRVNLAGRLRGADLVVTGEGCLDAQSMMGKVVEGVGRCARSCGVRAIAIAGRIGPGAESCREVIDAYYAVDDAQSKAAGSASDRLRARTTAVFRAP